MDDDTDYTHDKWMPMGFVKKHVAVEMEDSKSSDEDADIKKC